MITSIDGRLHPGRWSKPAAGIDPEKLEGHYDEIAGRYDVDGWIVGRQTMANMSEGKTSKAQGCGHQPARHPRGGPQGA
ncbi:MAG: hypothetical protein WDO13_18950 [Verrucomicrobiota bacterium]